VSNRQNVIETLVCGTSEMHSSLCIQERRPSLLDEDTAGLRQFHNPARIASEEMKLMLFFEVGNLLAERWLGNVQSVRSPCEVQFFGQDNHCVQVTDFEIGEHIAQNPRR
jgi:hypothetical protein